MTLRTRLALTDAGRAVLAWEANRVALMGFDRWIGGVHLSSEEGRMWWRRDERLVENR